MKAIAMTGVRKMGLVDIPKPSIEKDNDVLLKLAKVGICGSDMHYYEMGKIGSRVVEFPFIVGHECSATVVETGPEVRNVKPGDQVAVDPTIACHNCDQCRASRENTCRNLKFLGSPSQLQGCLCEYIVMPAECLYPVNDKLTLSQAVLSEPLSIAVYAVQNAAISKDAGVAILGAGPIGLSILAAAKAANVEKIFVTEKISDRIDAAKKAGAVWVGNPDDQDIVQAILQQAPDGADVVFECAGQQETIDQAVELLKPGGRLMLIGIPRQEQIMFRIERIRRKEITIINVRRQNRCLQAAIDLIASGRVDMDYMVTHRFKPEQAQEAFDMVADYRDGVIKAFIEF